MILRFPPDAVWFNRCGIPTSGQTLVSFVFMIVALFGFAGLATDIGYFYSVRRQMQMATDAAAVAASNQQADGTSIQAADDVAAVNGFPNGSASTTVTVTNPAVPASYPTGTYYQVVII